MSTQQRRSIWLYVFASPVGYAALAALFRDPFRWGDRSAMSEQSRWVLVGLAIFVLAMFGGTWRFSLYQHRTPVVVVLVVVTIASLVPFATDTVVTVGWLDLVVDATWVVSIGLLVLGGPARSTTSGTRTEPRD